MSNAPFVQSILYPSDFSEESHPAFVHALALALYRRARFDILHVVSGRDAVDDWSASPPVRRTLERWGLLEPDSPRSAVHKRLALDVAKLNIRSSNPLKAILADLNKNPSDLVVLATEGREGPPRWLKPSIAEAVAQRSRTKTLFVPKGSKGFVSSDDGRISLTRVLLPVDRRPSPDEAATYAARAAVMAEESPVEIVLLHVGDGKNPPWPHVPELKTCKWTRLQRNGNAVEQIARAAEELSADLIVMATEERKGILGMLRGSVTMQVLRQSSCPVLAVPAGSS